MAQFALGLTKTAVAGTVTKVKWAIEEEANLRVRVQDDLVFITGEFEIMQSFLNIANAGERSSKNQVVRTWVRQLRDLAFDVEDCVEFVINLDKASRWDWVRRLMSSLVCMARPPLPLDVAVAEISRLKARVEYVSQRNVRYNLLGGGGDDEDRQHQHLLMGPGGRCTSAAGAVFQDLREVWKAMGKLHSTTGDLKRLIDCHGSEIKVISLWRNPQLGDVGELWWATIVKKAYDDPEICQEFKHRAWVKLTIDHPFNPVEFLNNLLTHFTFHQHHSHDDISELMLQVSQHRYLIVLEQELTSVADWNAIRMCLPDGKNGSRIVINTKHIGIALVCTGDPYEVSELTNISHDRNLYAFSPKGSGHRIGTGELIWQLRRGCGVISLWWENYKEQWRFTAELREDTLNKLRVLDKLGVLDTVKFEKCCWYEFSLDNMADLARHILLQSYSEVEQDNVHKWLQGINDLDIIERCRKFLTENDWLLFIDTESPTEWNSIKEQLLCGSTRACIVVLTRTRSVATHCVDRVEHRVLTNQMLASDQQDNCGQTDRGVSINEEAKYAVAEMNRMLIVGRQDEMKFFDRGYSTDLMLSVWGIAGVGKSAIVRSCYRSYAGMYGWADVPHPFNLMDLCRRLVMDLYSGDHIAKETAAIGIMEGQDPIQWCRKILRENRCTLVFDGIQTMHDWDMIKETLLSHLISGTTIVITREESIATYCTDTKDHILNVKCLNDHLALYLFNEINLEAKQLSESSCQGNAILELIMSKCGGLPEVIVAVGKFTRPYLQEIGPFEILNDEFMRVLETSLSLNGLFYWMQSYFDACSDELKPCIFYMSVFNVHQKIRPRRLVRRWIAEGYCSGGAGTAEEKGKRLLFELMKLSMVYDHKFDTQRCCMVNGFFREYIKTRPMEDNLVFALEGSCSPNSRLTGQHLTISSSWDRDVNVYNVIDMSRLRSLTVSGEWRPFLICDKMKLLRVLDLEDTGTGSVTDDDLEPIGKLLPRLKFMSLRGCMQITRLPDSFVAMKQLETLDVRHTSIVELPPAIITKLQKLQYIRAGTTDTKLREGLPEASEVVQRAWKKRARRLEEFCSWWQSKNQLNLRIRQRVAANGGGVEIFPAAAKAFGGLTDLDTLGVVNVAGGEGSFLLLVELKKLTQLRNLGLSGINRKNWNALCLAISGHLPHLQFLSLQLRMLELEDNDNFDFACFDNISEPPKTLKILKVRYPSTGGRACIRPSWIKQLTNLENFNHELTLSSQEDIDSLLSYEFPRGVSRCYLRIKPTQQHLTFGRELQGKYGVGGLVFAPLEIDCSGISSTITFGPCMVGLLQEININCCSSCGLSCLQVLDIWRVDGLTRISVKGSCGEDLKDVLREQVDRFNRRRGHYIFLHI